MSDFRCEIRTVTFSIYNKMRLFRMFLLYVLSNLAARLLTSFEGADGFRGRGGGASRSPVCNVHIVTFILILSLCNI